MYQGLAALGLGKYIGRDASGTEMYLGLPAMSYRLVPRAGSPACPGLAALGPKKYIGRAASGTEMYLGLSALSYRLVPRAGSPACPGLAALGPEKYTGHGHFNLLDGWAEDQGLECVELIPNYHPITMLMNSNHNTIDEVPFQLPDLLSLHLIPLLLDTEC